MMATLTSNELDLFLYIMATLVFNEPELFHLIVLKNISDKVMYKFFNWYKYNFNTI